MDFGAPVAQNVNANPNQGVQTLSNLIGLQQNQQLLQQQQIATQQKATTFREQQALQQINPASYMKNGVLDAASYGRDAIAATPFSGLGVERAQKALEVQNSQLIVQKAAQGLNEDQRRDASNYLESTAQRSDGNWADVAKAAEDYKAENPGGAPVMDAILSRLNPQDPWQLTQQKLHSLNVALKGANTPVTGTTVDSTGKQVGTAQSPMTGALSSPQQPGVNLGFTPAQLAQTITLPNGQVTTLGAFLGKSVGGGGGAAPAQPATHGGRTDAGVQLTAANDPNRPSANAPKASQDSWSASVAQANKDVTDARTADQYGNNMAIAEQIRRLSSETNTGPGTPEFTRLIGMLTSRFGGSQGVTNTQTLESFLDRQASSLRTGMNLPATNAGEEQARTIGGNIGMQGGALQTKNSYNEALAQGLHDYRTGLDHVEGFSGNASPTAVNKFKSAWAQNFDPTAYEWKLAVSRGDKQTANAIASHLSPEQKREMQQKGRNLDLLTQGKLPQ